MKGYYESGKLKSETPYQDGKIEGMEKIYYESGQVKRETPYKNGHAQGLEKEYYESGQLIKKEILYSYHHDKELEKELCECERRGSEINGVVKEYHDNGKLASEIRYEDSQKEGIGKHYDKDNRFLITVSYQRDKAVSGICRSQSGREFPLTNAQITNWNNGLETGCE